VRSTHRGGRDGPHLVTEAPRPMSQDIAYREKRYLIMMGIRLVCFVIAVVMFVKGAGWLTAIPAVGAIVIPYFAVVFANGGREPSGRDRFRPYEPNLPQKYEPQDGSHGPNGGSDAGTSEPGGTDIPGSGGASGRGG
jgi:Protein of unknown function (DUF3099)